MRVHVQMHAYASMYRPFRRTAIPSHTRLTSGHEKAETYHAIDGPAYKSSDGPMMRVMAW